MFLPRKLRKAEVETPDMIGMAVLCADQDEPDHMELAGQVLHADMIRGKCRMRHHNPARMPCS